MKNKVVDLVVNGKKVGIIKYPRVRIPRKMKKRLKGANPKRKGIICHVGHWMNRTRYQITTWTK